MEILQKIPPLSLFLLDFSIFRSDIKGKISKELKMKTSSFLSGLAIGAVAAIAITKKLKTLCADEDDSCECDNDAALKDAENTVESLRSSADSLLNDLKTQTEAKQTYAAQCEDLKDQVAKKDAEIANLKNICDKQAGEISKLEAEQAGK